MGGFVAILVGETSWGVGIGWATLHLRSWARNPQVEMVLSVPTPFVAFWPPHELSGSGVLATVVAGFSVS